jgi:hypothetical protein
MIFSKVPFLSCLRETKERQKKAVTVLGKHAKNRGLDIPESEQG